MAENQPIIPDVDAELAKAKQSMGSRVDPDEPEATVTIEEPKAPESEPEKPPVADPDEPKDPEEPKGDDKKPEDPLTSKDKEPVTEPNKTPRAYIPVGKYTDEKREWEKTVSEKDAALVEAQRKITELEAIAGKKEGEVKDEDIEKFIEDSGFDRETVDGFLKLAEKRLLKPERVQAIEKIEAMTKEAEISAHFNEEFTQIGEPELKTMYPEATAEQLAAAKKKIDEVAHTKDFFDKSLDFVIYKHRNELAEIFTPAGEKPANDEKPADKKPMEENRIGGGKPGSFTAKDFEGATDFSALDGMDQAQRAAIIKDMPTSTYQNWVNYVKGLEQSRGLEVNRGGRKILLK